MPKPDMLPLDGEDGRTVTSRPNIIVAITGSDLDTELVTLGSTIAKTKRGNLFVIYGIQVPRKLAIDAEMPEETKAASEALEVAKGVADQMHVHVEPEIVQSRNTGQSIVEEACVHECSLLILGLPYHVGVGGHFDLGDTADYVLKNSPCRVWLIRGRQADCKQTEDQSEGIGAAR
jgi:nucleotide-binding universal stress UspA family protein